MPAPKNRVIPPPPPPHDHPSIYCYKKWGAKGCGREHDHGECREAAVTWQRENRRKNGGRAKVTRPRADAGATLRAHPLGEDELTRLRRAVGLVE